LVDQTTLIVLSTIVQTIVISLTLVIFTLSFRSQERAIREASYQGLMGRYNDLIGTIADKPELTRLMMGGVPGEKAPLVSDEDAAVFAHLLLAYGIIEEAFSLRKKKWIDEENWQQWAAFLRVIAGHPLFETMHNRTRGTFDPGFEVFVRQVLEEAKESTEDNPPSGAYGSADALGVSLCGSIRRTRSRRGPLSRLGRTWRLGPPPGSARP